MARYLSPEWFEEVNAAAAVREPSPARPGAPLVLQQVVTGAPEGEVRYWIRVHDGKVEAGLGEAETSDATIVQSYDTAVAVMTGKLSAQSALMAGAIRLSGNMAALVERQEALVGMDAAWAGVRERTSYVH